MYSPSRLVDTVGGLRTCFSSTSAKGSARAIVACVGPRTHAARSQAWAPLTPIEFKSILPNSPAPFIAVRLAAVPLVRHARKGVSRPQAWRMVASQLCARDGSPRTDHRAKLWITICTGRDCLAAHPGR